MSPDIKEKVSYDFEPPSEENYEENPLDMSMKVWSLIEETWGMMDNYTTKPVPYFAPPEPVVIE